MKVTSDQILTRTELALVVKNLQRKNRSPGSRLNLVILRLSACCGLRVSEIHNLKIRDVKTGGARPVIHVRRGKGGKARRVPLWWDGSTLSDLIQWKLERETIGKPNDPFVPNLHGRRHPATGANLPTGGPLGISSIQSRWKTITKILGDDRCQALSIHSGRHSFVSHALAGGRTIGEVRDAAGHGNIAVTNIYAHLVDDDEGIGDLFAFAG